MMLPSLSDPSPPPSQSRTWEDTLAREYGLRLVEHSTIVSAAKLSPASNSVRGLLWGAKVVQAVMEIVTGQ